MTKTNFTKLLTIAMKFTAKELPHVIDLIPSSQHANSLLEPIHELTDVGGAFDAVPLNGLTMDFAMNKGSLIGESPTSLFKLALAMIDT